MGKIIAAFLNLPEPERYTGHFLRTTSATLGAEAGFTVPQLQQLGTWKSAGMPKTYVQNSDKNRRYLANKLSTNMKKPIKKNANTLLTKNKIVPSTSRESYEIPVEFHQEMSQDCAMNHELKSNEKSADNVQPHLKINSPQKKKTDENLNYEIPEEFHAELSQDIQKIFKLPDKHINNNSKENSSKNLNMNTPKVVNYYTNCTISFNYHQSNQDTT